MNEPSSFVTGFFGFNGRNHFLEHRSVWHTLAIHQGHISISLCTCINQKSKNRLSDQELQGNSQSGVLRWQKETICKIKWQGTIFGCRCLRHLKVWKDIKIETVFCFERWFDDTWWYWHRKSKQFLSKPLQAGEFSRQRAASHVNGKPMKTLCHLSLGFGGDGQIRHYTVGNISLPPV